MTRSGTVLLVCMLAVLPAAAGLLVGTAVRGRDLIGVNPPTFFVLGILAGIALCGIALGLWQGLRMIGGITAPRQPGS